MEPRTAGHRSAWDRNPGLQDGWSQSLQTPGSRFKARPAPKVSKTGPPSPVIAVPEPPEVDPRPQCG